MPDAAIQRSSAVLLGGGAPGTVTIGGTLNSTANTSYVLDFYANTTPNPSGFGEGRTYLGSTRLDIGGDCSATFQNLALPLPPGAGAFISATATDPDGNTSEFGECFPRAGGNAGGSADLSLRVTAAPGQVTVSSNVIFTIDIVNSGPGEATHTVVVNPVPAKATFVSANATQGACVLSNGVVVCNLGTLGNKISARVTLTLRADAVGDLANNFTVTSDVPDPSTANNTYSALLTVLPYRPPGTADLAFDTLTAQPSRVEVGETITFSACVANSGPEAATNLVITTTLPPSAAFVRATSDDTTNITVLGRTVLSRFTTVLSGFRVCVNIDTVPREAGTVVFEASVSADTPDVNLADNASRCLAFVGEGPRAFYVTNTRDNGAGSFRQALLDSEANPGKDTIAFNIPETDPGLDPRTGAFTIVPIKPLPHLLDRAGIIIDGYTQPGSKPNTLVDGDNAVLRIEIDGSQSQKPSLGLDLQGNGCLIRGLVINRFLALFSQAQNLLVAGFGLYVEGQSNVVTGCFIGTDATGTKARGSESTGIFCGGFYTIIGGTNVADRNLLSGNPVNVGLPTSRMYTVVIGNFIGTDITGTNALPSNILSVDGVRNGQSGVAISGPYNRVGGATPAERNIISGSRGSGVSLTSSSDTPGGANAEHNLVVGNFIGTDVSGTRPVPNADGVATGGNSYHNTIGGTNTESRNLISGNGGTGVSLGGNSADILGNWIGLDVSGTRVLPNDSGVQVTVAFNNIGGPAPGAGNLISGNSGNGVTLWGAGDVTLIQRNRIGLDAQGNPAPNGDHGVYFEGTTRNTVAGNTIAFNGGNGVAIAQAFGDTLKGAGHTLSGNAIYANFGLGIDLGDDGITTNHLTSPNPGPNNWQNHPVLTSVTRAGNSLTMAGQLTSSKQRTYTLEFFASDAATPPGQGQTFLGANPVTTDASGNANFSFTLPLPAAAGPFITATATAPIDPYGGGGTSEFSPAFGLAGFADLAVSAATSAFAGVVGGNLVYTLSLTNNGPDAATAASLIDVLPAGADFVGATASQGGFTAANGQVAFHLGKLAVAGSATLTVTIRPTVVNTLTNTATVSANEADPVPLNNRAVALISVRGTTPADVAISITAAPSATAKTEFTFTLTVENRGPGDATGVLVSDRLPTPHRIVAVDTDRGSAVYDNGTVTGTIDRLPPGTGAHIAILVGFGTASNLTNTATVTANEPDPNPNNNTASVWTAVANPPPLVDLYSFGVSATPDPAKVGQPITYQGSFNNQIYYGTATNVVIQDRLPAGVTFVSATATQGTCRQTNGVVTCLAGDLPPGQGVGFTIVVIPTQTGILTNLATAGSAGTDADPNDNSVATTTQVIAKDGSADLAVTSAAANTVAPGGDFTYTLFVTNNGPGDATGVVLVDHLPPGLSFVTAVSGSGTCAFSNAAVTCALGSLTGTPPGGATIRITARAPASGTFTNAAEVHSDQLDSFGGNNLATQVTVVGAETSSALRITAYHRFTDGRFRVQFNAGAGTNYILQASSDLARWINLTNATPSLSGPYAFIDPDAAKYARRSYRLSVGTAGPRITSYRYLSNGGFRLQFNATAGTNYTLQVSSDLIHWSALTNASPIQSGPFAFIDPDAAKFGQRFYRLSMGMGATLASPRITGYRHLSGGQFQVQFNAGAGTNYVLQASPDLVHWSDLTHAMPSIGGPFQFTDPDAAKHGRRYYRVATP